jgi:hypothetical protein
MAVPAATSELWAVLLLLALFLAVNLATASRHPFVYTDEVMFADPAANLAQGLGLTSSSWFAQQKDQFWAGYPPLYPVVLAGWIRVWGFGLAEVRSLNHILIAVAALILWFSVLRLGLVGSSLGRITLTVMLLCGFGIAYCYRVGRPDCLAICLVSAALLVLTLRSVTMRYVLLAVLGALMALTGLQVVAFVAILLGLVFVFLRRTYLSESAVVIAGMACGVSILVALYWSHGVVGDFLVSAVGQTPVGRAGAVVDRIAPSAAAPFISRFLVLFQNRLPRDYSLVLLVGLTLIFIWDNARRGYLERHSLLAFALSAMVCIPTGLFVLGKFPTYYAWMLYIPLSVCMCAELSRARNRRVHAVLLAGLALTCVVGLPLHLASAFYGWPDRDYAPVERLIADQITRQDTVYSDYTAYFAVKPKAAGVVTPFYLFADGAGNRMLEPSITAAEKAAVTALVIDPGELERVTDVLGGHWQAVSGLIEPHRVGLFGWGGNFGILTLKGYKLQVFRKPNGEGLTRGVAPERIW